MPGPGTVTEGCFKQAPDQITHRLQVISSLGTGGNLTADTHLAALTIEYGAALYFTDNDFGRFNRLRWRNPLAG